MPFPSRSNGVERDTGLQMTVFLQIQNHDDLDALGLIRIELVTTSPEVPKSVESISVSKDDILRKTTQSTLC